MPGNHHELQVNLQRGIAEHTAKLGLRYDFGGHQIQKNNLQGSDVLGFCTGLLHNENIFVLQYSRGGKIIGYLNGHGCVLLMC